MYFTQIKSIKSRSRAQRASSLSAFKCSCWNINYAPRQCFPHAEIYIDSETREREPKLVVGLKKWIHYARYSSGRDWFCYRFFFSFWFIISNKAQNFCFITTRCEAERLAQLIFPYIDQRSLSPELSHEMGKFEVLRRWLINAQESTQWN